MTPEGCFEKISRFFVKNLIICEHGIDNAAAFWYNQRDDKRVLPLSPVSDEHKTQKIQKRVFCPYTCRLPTAYVPGHQKKQKTCRFLKRNVYKHRKTRQMGLTNKKRYAIINTINYWYCFFYFLRFYPLGNGSVTVNAGQKTEGIEIRY